MPIKRKILQRHPFSFLLRYCHEKANPHSLLLIRKMSVLTLTRATWSNMSSVTLLSNLACNKSSIFISQDPTTWLVGDTISSVNTPTSSDDKMTESFSNCRGEVCSAGKRISVCEGVAFQQTKLD